MLRQPQPQPRARRSFFARLLIFLFKLACFVGTIIFFWRLNDHAYEEAANEIYPRYYEQFHGPIPQAPEGRLGRFMDAALGTIAPSEYGTYTANLSAFRRLVVDYGRGMITALITFLGTLVLWPRAEERANPEPVCPLQPRPPRNAASSSSSAAHSLVSQPTATPVIFSQRSTENKPSTTTASNDGESEEVDDEEYFQEEGIDQETKSWMSQNPPPPKQGAKQHGNF